jgi:hypothetical protein
MTKGYRKEKFEEVGEKLYLLYTRLLRRNRRASSLLFSPYFVFNTRPCLSLVELSRSRAAPEGRPKGRKIVNASVVLKRKKENEKIENTY